VEEGWRLLEAFSFPLLDGSLPALALFLVGLALSYLFGLIVAATENYSSSKMEEMTKEFDEDEKRRAKRYDERWRDILYTALFSRVVSNVFVLLPPIVAEHSSAGRAFAVLLGAVIALFLAGYAFPRAVARRGEEKIFLRYAPFMHILVFPFYPVVLLGRFSDRFVGRMTGKLVDGSTEITEEEILDMVSDGELEGLIEEDEAEMIEKILHFDDLPVSEVMTPSAEVTAIDAEADLKQAVELALRAGHSRIPVFSGERREIVGVLYVKDLLRYWDDPSARHRKVRDIAREAYFIPESKKISDLFREFKAKHIHFAVVLDEYGGTSGIVTIEDILEEIVGEIEDEYDVRKAGDLARLPDGSWIVDGRIEIEELNRRLHLSLPENDRYDTVAGLILDALGKIPSRGECVELAGCKLTVLESDEKTIKKVTLTKVEQGESGGDGDRQD